MAESVETGGAIRFEYPKNYRRAPVNLEIKNDIERGYEDYYKRKKKEQTWKILMWLVIGLIVLGIGTYVILRN